MASLAMTLLLWRYYYGSTTMALPLWLYLLWPLLAIQAAFLGEIVAAVAARGMRTTTVLLSDHGHLERGGDPNPSPTPNPSPNPNPNPNPNSTPRPSPTLA